MHGIQINANSLLFTALAKSMILIRSDENSAASKLSHHLRHHRIKDRSAMYHSDAEPVREGSFLSRTVEFAEVLNEENRRMRENAHLLGVCVCA